MYKVKNALLLTITVLMGAIFMFSITSLDSPSFYPILGMLISGMWLLAFAAANGALEIESAVEDEGDEYETY